MRLGPGASHPRGVRTDESTGFSESGRGISRPVERLDLVEAIAHGPRSRAATVLTFQPLINPRGYVATRRALAPSHYTIPPTIASLTIQHSDTLCLQPSARAWTHKLGAAHALNSLPLSGHRGHRRACCRLDPRMPEDCRQRQPHVVLLGVVVPSGPKLVTVSEKQRTHPRGGKLTKADAPGAKASATTLAPMQATVACTGANTRRIMPTGAKRPLAEGYGDHPLAHGDPSSCPAMFEPARLLPYATYM
jgi:hypothetical protein